MSKQGTPSTDKTDDPPSIRVSRREQRDTSRQRLLDATIGCIIELGYAGTTTNAITERAGMSSGALFNHFGTKDELLVAAARDVFNKFLEESVVLAEKSITSARKPVKSLVDMLWELLKTTTMQAIYEIYTAARTNQQLHAALAVLVPDYTSQILALGAELFPQLSGTTELAGLMGMLMYAVQGESIMTLALGPDKQLAATKRVIVQAIEAVIAQVEATSS